MKILTKIILLVVIISLAIGLIPFLMVNHLMRSALERELEEKGKAVARISAELIAHHVINQEVFSAHEAFSQIMQSSPRDIDYIYLIGFDGKIFTHTFEDGFPLVLAKRILDKNFGTTYQLEKYLTEEGPILEVCYPLIEDMRASIHIGINEKHIFSQINNVSNRIIGLTFGIVLLGIIIGVAVSLRITRPLGQLAGSMQAFGSGKVGDKPLKVYGGGEVGELTKSFNRMIAERKKLEAQLRQAQKMEAVGHLAGGVAHDFNNILTAIMGYGNLLLINMAQDNPLREYVNQILASVKRAANLIQSLLAFSRKQIVQSKPVDLNRIVKDVKTLLSRLIGEDIELKTVLADENIIINADRGQIEQLLMNFATNARDAMPAGGEFIISTGSLYVDDEFIRSHGYGEPGWYAKLTVTDNGEGMDGETKEKIFDPFFTTKEIGKGTGLGLAIVYGIIKQYHGYINVYSEKGKGTTFTTYLPLIQSEIEKIEVEETTVPSGGTETVLVAEDDTVLRELTKRVLEKYGYRVKVAVDGGAVLERFMEHKEEVQLLILDVIMPKKNGREVYEEIRKIAPGIKTLFISGYTGDILHSKGILDQGLNFIQKPVSPKELLARVREILDS